MRRLKAGQSDGEQNKDNVEQQDERGRSHMVERAGEIKRPFCV